MGSPQCNKWISSFFDDQLSLLDDLGHHVMNSYLWSPQPVLDDTISDCSKVDEQSNNEEEEKVLKKSEVDEQSNNEEEEEKIPKKRSRIESGKPGVKACREKMRRDKLNDRFMELGIFLDPERFPKMDKAAILSETLTLVKTLRQETEKLKDSNEQLQEYIKELKIEKHELRDEKAKLKMEKERLEQQIKATMTTPAGIMQQYSLASALAAQTQATNNKSVNVPGFLGIPMWQWMPPSAVDTSQDHMLRPPVA